jgi:acyl-[acyl-carrier-protein]-phospholipid O-acyltransferase/long-chain-fatty-acid--[acyl-carrier-protein] ligase
VVVGLFVAYLTLAWLFPPLTGGSVRVLARVLYRVHVYGRERIPESGGCLIVCNHISYVDWLILKAACPRRLTFVLWAGYYRNPVLTVLLSWARGRTVRIPDRLDHPHALAAGLQQVADTLDRGEVVLMFPEGRLTRSGHMLRFGRGVELVLKQTRTDVAVIPAGIDGLWGGVFSYHGGRMIGKRPRAFRPHVAVAFGEPLSKTADAAGRARKKATSPASGKDVEELTRSVLPAAELRLVVQEVVAECVIRQTDFELLVHRAFVRNAVRFGNLFRPCVIDNAAGEKILTWGKTFAAAVCVTGYLRSRVGPEANVGVWLPTGLGGALANLAIAFLGKTSVNLNYTAGADAVRSAVRQAGVRVVVTAKRFLLRVPLDLPDEVQRIYLEDVLTAITKWQQVRTFLLALVLPGWVIDRFVLRLHRHSANNILTIVFSSGSTGEPKGVVLSHQNVGSNVAAAIRTIQIRPGDRLFGVLPFFHSFGYTVCLWAPLVAGAVVVYYPDPRGAKEVGLLVRKHRATLAISTATFLRFYLRRCEADDFRSIRLLICGAEKLPVKLQEEFRARFGVLPLEGYGCTELSPVVSTNLPNTTVGGFTQVCNVQGTIGQPITGVCVRAFTQDSREPLPPGQEGVLCAKGPNVMVGYLNQPEKTAEAIRDGWYSTGDVGLVRLDGFIQITGRLSRFAKIAGEMVPLERLEEEMHEAIGSGGDRVLAVVAVPDEKRGERVVVLYVPEVEGKVAGLLDALSSRGLPNLWVPGARDCYKVDALPTLGSGKLDLKRLGEVAREVSAR